VVFDPLPKPSASDAMTRSGAVIGNVSVIFIVALMLYTVIEPYLTGRWGLVAGAEGHAMATEFLPEDLTGEEKRFLLHSAETGVLAYRPREDPMISLLFQRGYLRSLPDQDPDYGFILLTAEGRAAVAMIRDAMNWCPKREAGDEG
jgi:hypothetical protein